MLMLALLLLLGPLAVPLAALPQEPGCPSGAHQLLPFPLQSLVAHPIRRAHCFTPDAADRGRVAALSGYRCVLL